MNLQTDQISDETPVRMIGHAEQIAFTPEQAAVVIGRSRTRVFKAIKDKEITARKDGNATLLEASELRRWVRSLPTTGRRPPIEGII